MPLPLALLPLLIMSGLIALVLWPRVRSGPAGARVVTEVVLTTLALCALPYGLMVAAQRLP